MLVGIILCHPHVLQHIHNVLHSMAETEMPCLQNLDIDCPGLKLDCTDEFQRRCYLLLAAWVKDKLEQMMIAQLSYC